ncbi:MAG: M20/M25/M40 family metallo-hydrolase, partial [Fermentimonas sp.]
DAGGSVVSMIMAFLHFKNIELPINIILALSAEEENSGPNGMRALWVKIKNEVDMAIVGEPTGMKASIGERGLLVIDGVAEGVSGHAARDEGVNALYIALDDIAKLRKVDFDKVSPTMGKIKLTVTQIEAGSQHNVVPDLCKFVVDIRPTELYTNQEIMDLLQPIVRSKLKARSLTNHSSTTPMDHELYKCVEIMGIEMYTSPTTSDWMRISCPAIKMGPGESSRSHQADEYILMDELEMGISGYINFISHLSELF